MNIKKVYEFNKPVVFIDSVDRLISKEYSVFVDVNCYREMWIASRFCYGLNKLKNENNKIRLVKDEFLNFQLKHKKELLSFKLIEIRDKNKTTEAMKNQNIALFSQEEFFAVIKDIIQNQIDKYAHILCALLCFIDIPYSGINDKEVEEIAAWLCRQKVPFNEIWLFTNSQEETHVIARIYPEVDQLYVFDIIKEWRARLIITLVLILTFVLMMFLALREFNTISTGSNPLNIWDLPFLRNLDKVNN